MLFNYCSVPSPADHLSLRLHVLVIASPCDGFEGDDDHPVYREWEDDKKLIGRFISVYYWISVIDNEDNKRSLVNDDGGGSGV